MAEKQKKILYIVESMDNGVFINIIDSAKEFVNEYRPLFEIKKNKKVIEEKYIKVFVSTILKRLVT